MSPDWQAFGFCILLLLIIIAAAIAWSRNHKAPPAPTLDERRARDLESAAMGLYDARGRLEEQESKVAYYLARIARLTQERNPP